MGNACPTPFIIEVEIPEELPIPVAFPNRTGVTVERLKQELWQTIGVEKSHQLFSFNSALLSEGRNLAEYGIQSGDTVQLIKIPTLKIPALITQRCIYVQLQSGDVFPVTVPYIHTTKTISLKEYIQCTNGIPKSQQNLIYAGKQLSDYRTLKAYGVQHGDVLFLLLLLPAEFTSLDSSNIQDPSSVNVILPSGRRTTVNITDVCTFKTDHIKQVVSTAAHIPMSEQVYAFRGVVLEGNHSLKHHGIRYGDSLHLIRAWYEDRSRLSRDINKVNACKTQVSVILQTGKVMKLTYADVDSFTTELIKQVICQKEHVPVGQQKLFFFGRLLKDYQTLKEHDIDNNEELHLTVMSPGHMLLPESNASSRQPTTIDVVLPSGNKLCVNVPDKETYKIELLKGAVKSIIDAPEETQKYSFNGKLLHDYPSLSDYDIQYGDILHMTLLHPTKRVYIKSGKARDLTILIPDLDIVTVLDVKEAISKQEGTTPGQLWLTYAERELRNNITLQEYSIGYGDTLDMDVIPGGNIVDISDLVRLASFHEAVYVGGHNIIIGPLKVRIHEKIGHKVISATLRGQDIGNKSNLSALTNATWFLVIVDAAVHSSRNVNETTVSGIKLAIYPLRNAS